jgi:hypothetical protein
MQVHNQWQRFLLATGGVAIAVVVGLGIRAIPTAEERRVEAIVDHNLAVAEEEAGKGLEPQLLAVREMFSRARSDGTRAFAEDALGWSSKFKMTKDYLLGGKEHGRYLEERFAARIFSEKDIERTIQAAVAAYLRHLDDVESQLLVNLEADLTAVSPGETPANIDRQAIEQALAKAIQDAVQAAAADTRGMIGQELVSYIAGDVLAIAAIELATSSGILSAGAASGTVTLGVGLVVGLIVDYLVSWAYDKYYDPIGELTRQLDNKLTELEEFIVIGTPKSPGLEKRLQGYAARRAQARSVAIKAAVMP